MTEDKNTYGDFWKRRKELRDVDLTALDTCEDIRPGGGIQWQGLWDNSIEVRNDVVWASFLGGDRDQSRRREVRWLLGV